MAEGSQGFRWLEVGGKRPCDGCGATLRVDQVQVVNAMRQLVFCARSECWVAWRDSLAKASP